MSVGLKVTRCWDQHRRTTACNILAWKHCEVSCQIACMFVVCAQARILVCALPTAKNDKTCPQKPILQLSRAFPQPGIRPRTARRPTKQASLIMQLGPFSWGFALTETKIHGGKFARRLVSTLCRHHRIYEGSLNSKISCPISLCAWTEHCQTLFNLVEQEHIMHQRPKMFPKHA